MAYDVIIIGAGVAGLVAAYELVKKGYQPLVLESGNEIGGLLASYHFKDYSIEKFYHHIFPHAHEFLRLAKELGFAHEIEWHRGSVGYWVDGSIFPLDTPLEIARYPHLTLSDKIRLASFVLKIKSLRHFSFLDSVTVKEWVERHCGENVYRSFFEPLLKAKFGNAADKISAAWLYGRIKMRSDRSFTKGEILGYPKKGFHSFINALATAIQSRGDIVFNAAVAQILTTANQVEGVRLADGRTYRASKVISTVAPQILRRLCSFPSATQKMLESLKSQSVVCALLELKESLMDVYWLNIKSETVPFGILIEHTNLLPSPAYGKTKLVYAVSYCHDSSDPFYLKSDAAVIQEYVKGLQEMFNFDEKNLLGYHISRSTEAGPIYYVDYGKNVPPYFSGIDGLFMTGIMHSYPDREVNNAVIQGQKCARLLQTHTP